MFTQIHSSLIPHLETQNALAKKDGGGGDNKAHIRSLLHLHYLYSDATHTLYATSLVT